MKSCDGPRHSASASRGAAKLLLAGLCGLVAALSILTLGSPAAALENAVVLRPLQGSAPLALEPGQGFQGGTLLIENRGVLPVRVTRVGVRSGDTRTSHSPASLSAGFADGTSSVRLEPGASRKIDVRWSLSRDNRVREVYAHVVAELEGDGLLVVGVHGELSRFLPAFSDRPLSWFVWLPISGLIGIAVLRMRRYQRLRSLRWIAFAVGVAQFGVWAVVYARFDASFSRLDGNSGYQFIESAPLLRGLGVEYALGIDGLSLPLLLLVPLSLIVASVLGGSIDRKLEQYWACVLVLDCALSGAFVTLDGMLFVGFAGVALALVCVLASPARWLVGSAVLAAGLILGALWYVSGHADWTYMSDGTLAARTFSMAELRSISLGQKGLSILGVAATKLVWTAFFVGFALIAPVVPLHARLTRAFATTALPSSVFLCVAYANLGVYGMLRFCLGILPDASAWAAPSIAWLGAIVAVYASICLLWQTDLRRFVAYVLFGHLGLALLGMSSLTAIGIEGTIAGLLSRALVCAALLASIAVLETRVHESDSARFGGIAKALPRFALLVGVVFTASAGAPGTSTFTTDLLVLIGAFPTQRLATLLTLLAVALAAVAHARTFGKVFWGELSPEWQSSRYLEPHGGRFPELYPRETALLSASAVLLVTLGCCSSLLLRVVDAVAYDYAAVLNPAGPAQVARDARPDPTPESFRDAESGENAALKKLTQRTFQGL